MHRLLLLAAAGASLGLCAGQTFDKKVSWMQGDRQQDLTDGSIGCLVWATDDSLITSRPNPSIRIMQTKTVTTHVDTVHVPPAGGTRPVGHFGVDRESVRAHTLAQPRSD